MAMTGITTLLTAVAGCNKECYKEGVERCVVGWPDGSCGGTGQGRRWPIHLRQPLVLDLGEGRYAVRYTFERCERMTLARIIPPDLQQLIDRPGYSLHFPEETVEEAGTKRADSELMRKEFPVETAIIAGNVDDPLFYIIVTLVEE